MRVKLHRKAREYEFPDGRRIAYNEVQAVRAGWVMELFERGVYSSLQKAVSLELIRTTYGKREACRHYVHLERLVGKKVAHYDSAD